MGIFAGMRKKKLDSKKLVGNRTYAQLQADASELGIWFGHLEAAYGLYLEKGGAETFARAVGDYWEFRQDVFNADELLRGNFPNPPSWNSQNPKWKTKNAYLQRRSLTGDMVTNLRGSGEYLRLARMDVLNK